MSILAALNAMSPELQEAALSDLAFMVMDDIEDSVVVKTTDQKFIEVFGDSDFAKALIADGAGRF